jgi:4-amino-4-deoxy-L-arabinose transferase-like glycosyltransferase
MTFLEDEGRDLLIMHKMIDTLRPVLLGPQTSTGNMYLGPLYYYIVTPALFLAQMDPLGPVVLIALTGVLTVWLLFRFGSKWFGKFSGVMAALMYSVLPLPVSFTRNSWNPNLAPVFSLLILWYLVKIVENKEYTFKNFLLLGILSGCLVQMHYMTLLYLLGTGVTLLIYLRRALPSLLRGVIFAGLGFVISLLPFIVFEIRNDFVNTHAITRFIEAKEEHNIRYTLPAKLYLDKVTLTTTRLFASQFGRDSMTTDPYRTTITLLISLIILVGIYTGRKATDSRSRILKLIFLTFIIPLAFIGIYQENIHLHYLGFFFPLTYLLVAGTMTPNNPVRWLSGPVLIFLIIYSSPQLLGYLSSSGTNQVIRARDVASYIVKESGGEPYNMVSASGTHTTPFLYFTSISDHPPTTTFVPTLFIVCQGRPCQDGDIDTPFIFITGPAHPTIEKYLGHPLMYYFDGERQLISNEHVSHGAWVAKINVKIDP